MCVVERRSPLRACQAIGNDDDDDGAHFFVRFSSFWDEQKRNFEQEPDDPVVVVVVTAVQLAPIVNTEKHILGAHEGRLGTF